MAAIELFSITAEIEVVGLVEDMRTLKEQAIVYIRYLTWDRQEFWSGLAIIEM